MSLVLSGRELAASIRAETAARAAELTAAGRTPTLAVVTATADEASAWYLRRSRGRRPGPGSPAT